MILRILACAAVVGCYAPHPPEGAPCTDSARCPAGQSCVAGFCSSSDASPPPDARPDAPPVDTDGDGIIDSLDNCPMVANPGQENEDGDPLGDACDPCPGDPGDGGIDSDGDGVGDACDPNPMKPGDRIVLFEGFHHGVPTDWMATAGAVTASGDDVTITAAAATHAFLAPPLAAPTDATLSASATIGTVDAPGTDDADFGIGLPYATGNDVGILCWVYQPPSAGARAAALENHSTRADLASAPFAWQTGTDYVFTLQRTATSYRCNIAAPGMTTAPLAGSAALSPASPLAIVRGFGTTTTVHWVMLVQSP